jgi:hypothetical protein
MFREIMQIRRNAKNGVYGKVFEKQIQEFADSIA